MTTSTNEAQALLLRLLDPSNRADPYPVFEEIRSRGPLLLGDSNLVVFSSWQDCGDVEGHRSLPVAL